MAPNDAPDHARSPRRLLLALAGIACVGLAGIGVFVPGLPTTIFLILASYLITRSCPHLEERLLGHRLFRPYLKYVYGDEPMPRRARITATALMWGCVLTSLTLLNVTADPTPWLSLGIVALAGVGTWFVWRIRRAPRVATLAEESV